MGNILSNMHLTLGLGFLFGGINRMQQHYNVTVGRLFGTMLLPAMSSLIIPTVIQLLQPTKGSDDVLRLSRAICIILLSSYFVFMFFSLKTHVDIYNEPSQKTPKRHRKTKEGGVGIVQVGAAAATAAAGDARQGMALTTLKDEDKEHKERDSETFEEHEPQLSVVFAIICLVVFTALLAFLTSFATDSLDGLIQNTGLTDTFIGIVLLPLLSVDFTVIGIAMKDKMDPLFP